MFTPLPLENGDVIFGRPLVENQSMHCLCTKEVMRSFERACTHFDLNQDSSLGVIH